MTHADVHFREASTAYSAQPYTSQYTLGLSLPLETCDGVLICVPFLTEDNF